MAFVLRCSLLNWALVANENKCSKSVMFKANVRVFLARFCISIFSLLGFVKIVLRFLLWLDFLFHKPIYLLKVSSVILSA